MRGLAELAVLAGLVELAELMGLDRCRVLEKRNSGRQVLGTRPEVDFRAENRHLRAIYGHFCSFFRRDF